MSETSPVIEVAGLSKTLGGRTVLDDLYLEVERGETLVILGASGSGKSTLLRCAIGLERPDAGTVRLLETDLYASDRRSIGRVQERIGVSFQGGALFGSMSVADNVDLPLDEFTELPISTRRILVRIKLTMVGMEAAFDKYPSELSGGMKKRAALARAMALDPEVLFFDEPSAGLDPITAGELDRLILQLKAVFGVTMVVVTHELDSAFKIADRIALLHEGHFVAIGTPDEITASSNRVVRRFLDRRAIPAATVVAPAGSGP